MDGCDAGGHKEQDRGVDRLGEWVVASAAAAEAELGGSWLPPGSRRDVAEGRADPAAAGANAVAVHMPVTQGQDHDIADTDRAGDVEGGVGSMGRKAMLRSCWRRRRPGFPLPSPTTRARHTRRSPGGADDFKTLSCSDATFQPIFCCSPRRQSAVLSLRGLDGRCVGVQIAWLVVGLCWSHTGMRAALA